MDKMLAGLDKYVVANSENPRVYTRDLASCIAVLLHLSSSSILMHVPAYKNGIIELDNFKSLIGKVKSEIINVEIFKGPITSDEHLNLICNYLMMINIAYDINNAFVNYSNQCSIGYDYNLKNYYMINMHNGYPEFIHVPLKKLN